MVLIITWTSSDKTWIKSYYLILNVLHKILNPILNNFPNKIVEWKNQITTFRGATCSMLSLLSFIMINVNNVIDDQWSVTDKTHRLQ